MVTEPIWNTPGTPLHGDSTLSSSKGLIKRFLLLSILPSLLFIIAVLSIEWSEHKVLENRHLRQQNALALLLVEGLAETIRDIMVNGHHATFIDRPGYSALTAEERNGLEMELHAQVKYSSYYDQLRVLGIDGMEIIRINQTEYGPKTIPAEELQNKAARYYFKEGISVPEGHIYISPLDLNVEHGAIEVPHKPMLRVAYPVRYKSGNVRYLLVSNIRIQVILEKLITLNSEGNTQISVIDTDGYFLLSPDSSKTFGWQIPERSSQLLPKTNAELWEKFQNAPSGTFWKGLTLHTWYRLNLPKALINNLNRCDQDGINEAFENDPAENCQSNLTQGIQGFDNAVPLYMLSTQELRVVIGDKRKLLLTILLFLGLQGMIMVFVKRSHEIDYLRISNERNLARMAFRDPLTGLNNRRALNDHYSQEFARGLRNGKMPCLILLDLDHFKKVNDIYGHEKGDQVLKALSGVLTNCIRVSDIAARHGGEEFTILLPETNILEASRIAERIRAHCEEKVGSQTALKQAITVSIGVSQATAETVSINEILKEADDRMYVAKKMGRNRVISEVPNN